MILRDDSPVADGNDGSTPFTGTNSFGRFAAKKVLKNEGEVVMITSIVAFVSWFLFRKKKREEHVVIIKFCRPEPRRGYDWRDKFDPKRKKFRVQQR